MGDPQRDRLVAETLKVKYAYASMDEFIRESSNDISLFGIFISMKSPLKEGVTLQLDFRLDDGSSVIRGLGQVVWRRETAQSDNQPSGIGIRFLKLDPASRYTVERAVEARGLTPSRFDRLGEVKPRATSVSERPAHKGANALVGTGAEDVFNLDNPSSPSLDPNAVTSGSRSEESRLTKYSYTRQKTVLIPNREEDEIAWSGEELERLDRAFSASENPPEAVVQAPVVEQTTDVSSDLDAFSRASWRPEDTDSSGSLLGAEKAVSSPNREEDEIACSGEELERLDRAFSASENPPEAVVQTPVEQTTDGTEAPIAAELNRPEGVELPSVGSKPTSAGPPATTFTQDIPQRDVKRIQIPSIGSALSATATRDDTYEAEPPSDLTKVTTLRERLAKQTSSAPPAVSSDHGSTRRAERLTELSIAEIRQYAQGQRGLKVAAIEERISGASRRSGRLAGNTMDMRRQRGIAAFLSAGSWILQVVWRLISRMGASAAAAARNAIESIRVMSTRRRRAIGVSTLSVLMLVGGIGGYRVLAPKASRAAGVWSDKTYRALMTAGAEVHRGMEELGLVGALHELSEPEQSTDRRSKRYLLKIVTQPAGATVAVGDRHFITPCEVELDKPERALRISVRKKMHRSIQRRITFAEFHPEGNYLTYTLDVRLEKLPSTVSRPKTCKQCETALENDAPPPESEAPTPRSEAPAPKREIPARKEGKAPTFYLEPMPEFPK